MADDDAKLHVLINGWAINPAVLLRALAFGFGQGHRVFAPVTGLGLRARAGVGPAEGHPFRRRAHGT